MCVCASARPSSRWSSLLFVPFSFLNLRSRPHYVLSPMCCYACSCFVCVCVYGMLPALMSSATCHRLLCSYLSPLFFLFLFFLFASPSPPCARATVPSHTHTEEKEEMPVDLTVATPSCASHWRGRTHMRAHGVLRCGPPPQASFLFFFVSSPAACDHGHKPPSLSPLPPPPSPMCFSRLFSFQMSSPAIVMEKVWDCDYVHVPAYMHARTSLRGRAHTHTWQCTPFHLLSLHTRTHVDTPAVSSHLY